MVSACLSRCLLRAALLCATSLVGLAQDPGPSEVLPAEFRWAQRKDRILLTIELQGVHDETFHMTSEGVFHFEGTGSYRDQRDTVARYAVDLKVCKYICMYYECMHVFTPSVLYSIHV
jgi:hypothetical protein